MSSLLRALTGLFTPSPDLTQDRDARYLEQSADLYDLERRMREIDSRTTPYTSGPYGIFMR